MKQKSLLVLLVITTVGISTQMFSAQKLFARIARVTSSAKPYLINKNPNAAAWAFLGGSALATTGSIMVSANNPLKATKREQGRKERRYHLGVSLFETGLGSMYLLAPLLYHPVAVLSLAGGVAAWQAYDASDHFGRKRSVAADVKHLFTTIKTFDTNLRAPAIKSQEQRRAALPK